MRQRDRDDEFTTFTRTHRGQLLRLGRLLTAGDVAAAEDLVQVSLTKIYLAWPSVRRADSPLNYAQRVLSNAFIDEGRRAHRRREVLQDDASGRRDVDPRQRPDTGSAADLEMRSVVLDALRTLPPRQRAVVVMRHWLDLDVETTAAELGCSTGTVKSQNSKGLQHLRERLGALNLDLTVAAEPGTASTT